MQPDAGGVIVLFLPMENLLAVKPLSVSTAPVVRSASTSPKKDTARTLTFIVFPRSALQEPKLPGDKDNVPRLSFKAYEKGVYTTLKVWDHEDAVVAHQALVKVPSS